MVQIKKIYLILNLNHNENNIKINFFTNDYKIPKQLNTTIN